MRYRVQGIEGLRGKSRNEGSWGQAGSVTPADME